MAVTKEKKKEIVETGSSELGSSKVVVFTDFKGTSVSDLVHLRSELRSLGSKFSVIKKRLLGVIFKEKKIDLDPLKYEGQLGTVFVTGEISETAGSLYRFARDHKGFKLLGAYNLEEKKEIDEETINTIGSLPPREILLAQAVGSIASPIRSLLYVLSEKSKQN